MPILSATAVAWVRTISYAFVWILRHTSTTVCWLTSREGGPTYQSACSFLFFFARLSFARRVFACRLRCSCFPCCAFNKSLRANEWGTFFTCVFFFGFTDSGFGWECRFLFRLVAWLEKTSTTFSSPSGWTCSSSCFCEFDFSWTPRLGNGAFHRVITASTTFLECVVRVSICSEFKNTVNMGIFPCCLTFVFRSLDCKHFNNDTCKKPSWFVPIRKFCASTKR